MVSLCVMAESSVRMAFPPLAGKRTACQCAAMNVEILLFDGVEDMDVFGPVSALAPAGFEVALVAEDGPRQVRTAHGTELVARAPGAAPDVLLVARALPSVHSASALTSCIYQQVTVHVSNVSMISQPRIAWRSKLAHEAPSGHVGHERAFSLTGLIKTQRGLRVSRG